MNEPPFVHLLLPLLQLMKYLSNILGYKKSQLLVTWFNAFAKMFHSFPFVTGERTNCNNKTRHKSVTAELARREREREKSNDRKRERERSLSLG